MSARKGNRKSPQASQGHRGHLWGGTLYAPPSMSLSFSFPSSSLEVHSGCAGSLGSLHVPSPVGFPSVVLSLLLKPLLQLISWPQAGRPFQLLHSLQPPLHHLIRLLTLSPSAWASLDSHRALKALLPNPSLRANVLPALLLLCLPICPFFLSLPWLVFSLE